MKIGIMQPYFMPYIGYWQLINTVDEYVVFDDVNYIKRGWINRNYILLNGNKKLINLHIKDASQNRLIKETEVAQTANDNKILLNTIRQSYHKAPHFQNVYPLFEHILECPSKNLASYLENQIIEICDYLGIKTKILLSSNIDKHEDLKGECKILDICHQRNANAYINAIGGTELYHKHNFETNNIRLYFLKTKDIKYKQFRDLFVPNLSIIDVMMFCTADEIHELLEQYELIEAT